MAYLNKMLFFIAINLIACFANVLFAAPTHSIGKVLWVQGAVKASQPQVSPRILKRGSDVFENDTLSTDATSTGEIVFTDNSMFSLRSSTIVVLAKYAYGKNVPKAQESFLGKLTKGGFRTITGAISHDRPDGYSTVTPVATIGVRGTQYSVYYTNAKGMATKLERGSISVQNGAGTIVMKKCTQDEVQKSNCKDVIYSRVTSATSAPVIVPEQPAEFNNDVPIYQANSTTCPFCSVNNVNNPLTNGGVVSGFCIK